MSQSSLSISNSECSFASAKGGTGLQCRIVVLALWTIGALALIDVMVGVIFAPPRDLRLVPSPLQVYFEYGRSIEGKLRRQVGATPQEDAPIVKAGWLANECDVGTPAQPGKAAFDIYGMSFTGHIADQLIHLSPKFTGHVFGGPAAPVNHSYACFVRRFESGRELGAVQILGVLASSVRRMVTISGLTTSFERMEPFTYPRYSLAADGQLVGFSPSIANQEDLRAALANPQQFGTFAEELETHDDFYSRLLFKADIFDNSVVGRMIRRAWGQRVIRVRTAALQPNNGFSDASEIGPVLRAMLNDFIKRSRSAGKRPIVILIEDKGYGGTLEPLAGPSLRANGAEYIATSTIASPDDPSNFNSDGHFTPAIDKKIALALLDMLNRRQM